MKTTRDEHPDDAALLSVVDAGGPTGPIAAHLASCPPCASRLETLRHRSSRLTHLLESADVAPRRLPAAAERPRPTRRSIPPAAAIAAAVAVLLMATVAVPPVRALLVDGLRRILPTSPTTPVRSVPEEPTTEARADSSTVVRFPVRGDVFRLVIDHHQRNGVVSIKRTTEALASASISGGTGTEALIVRASGLRIVNDTGSTSSYRVTLPLAVGHITLAVAGRPDQRLSPPAADSLIISISNPE